MAPWNFNEQAVKELKMYFIRKQIEELKKIDWPVTRRPDFEEFWKRALKRVSEYDSHPERVLLKDYPYDYVKVYDVTVHGLDGTPVKAWLYVPGCADKGHPAPGAAYFHGGESSRGKWPNGALPYALAGCVVLQTEFRLQGGVTSSATPMHRCGGSFVTNNLDRADPQEHYFYHAFTDQLLMLKYLFSLPEVDPSRVAVVGASQGGGTSLIMSALEPRISLCLAGVPSFCCWERRVFTRTACAAAVAQYLQVHPELTEQVFRVLSYYDAMNFADRIRCRVKMQVCLKDNMAPPDCAFSAYNRMTCQKDIQITPMGEHQDVDYEKWAFDLREFREGK